MNRKSLWISVILLLIMLSGTINCALGVVKEGNSHIVLPKNYFYENCCKQTEPVPYAAGLQNH